MFQFIAQRGGYLAPNATYGDLLTATGDTYRSTKYNVPFEDGHPVFNEAQAVAILTATEALFIKAECLSRTGAAAAVVAAAYQAAITQSFNDLGLPAASSAAYVAAQPAAPSITDIMTQKYLAMYCDPEAFNDWRRTGVPALIPTGPAVPRRFLYPTSEINLNTANTPAAKITDRVSWDIQ